MANWIRTIGIGVVVLAALLQWIVVLERCWAAAWQWYKFADYGGGGYITVGSSTQIVFFVLSTAISMSGFFLARYAEQAGVAVLLSKIGAISLLAGMIVWAVVLTTPLVTFRQ